jgi:hypothetical protein
MNHAEATRQSAVEKYLLQELSPELRDAFEEHFFDCEECSTDLRAMTVFLTQVKEELARPVIVPAAKPTRKLFSFPSLLRPAFAAPAMAAMLLLIGFQNIVTLPHLRNQASLVSRPQLLPSVNLVDAGSRGETMRTVTAGTHQPFLLFVDIPAESRFASYLCSLYSPSGNVIWQITVPSAQASDTVSIQVPPESAHTGVNTLLVQGITTGQQNTPVDLVRYRFLLQSPRLQ